MKQPPNSRNRTRAPPPVRSLVPTVEISSPRWPRAPSAAGYILRRVLRCSTLQLARPRRSVYTMSVVTVAAMCVPAKRICPRAGRRSSRGARRVLSVRAAGENPSPPEEEDLPKPIKLTPEQAKVAALAFELLYEKDPVEELESMLVDKERPELRAKLQRAIEGA